VTGAPDAPADEAPDVVVLRSKIHGRAGADLAARLREQLPDRTVAVARTPAEERALLERATVAVGERIDPDLVGSLGSPPALFACVFAGTDHLPTDRLAEQGVAVTNASGVHGPNVAEHVLGAILAFVRGFDRARRQAADGVWSSFHVDELAGSTVTVVGMGAIGEAVIDRLAGFDVRTVGVRHTPSKGGPTDETYGYDDLHEALAGTDHLVLACPLTGTTEGLIDADALRTLPPTATLVNVARGEVVVTDALVDALRWNELRGAALDVTDPEPLPAEHPLWSFDETLITPHNAGNTPRYHDRVATLLARNLDRVDETGRFENLENQVRP
jgi:phosphoglycerate dehydrogenase-like enzyme